VSLAKLVDAVLIGFEGLVLIYVQVRIEFYDHNFDTKRTIRCQIILEVNRHAVEFRTVS